MGDHTPGPSCPAVPMDIPGAHFRFRIPYHQRICITATHLPVRPQAPTISIPRFPLVAQSTTGSSQHHHNASGQMLSQGVPYAQSAFRDVANNAGFTAPCLGIMPTLSIVKCNMGCGQYLAMKDNGQASGHITRAALYSLFQELCGQFQGNEGAVGSSSSSQEQYVPQCYLATRLH